MHQADHSTWAVTSISISISGRISWQTTIVAAGFWLDKQDLPVALEAALLIALTAASCFAFHEIVRRVPPLRPLGGLKLNPVRTPRTATA